MKQFLMIKTNIEQQPFSTGAFNPQGTQGFAGFPTTQQFNSTQLAYGQPAAKSTEASKVRQFHSN